MSTRKRKRTSDHGTNHVATKSEIIVSVDFGTTFSGIAYALTASPDDQYSITSWPDAVSGAIEGKTRDKVPT